MTVSKCSYLSLVALQRLLQLGLGGGGLLLVGLSQVFDGRGVDVVQLRAQGGCGENDGEKIRKNHSLRRSEENVTEINPDLNLL